MPDLQITSNKRKEKNVRSSVTIMNMAESKPRPLPKPRERYNLCPNNTVNKTSIPNISSSAPLGKPPDTKPKPAGYKRLEFNNKTLVDITTDIDIGDDCTSNRVETNEKANEEFETNNNVANLKHRNDKRVIGNGTKDNKASLSITYNKPLPPLPAENSAKVEEENNLNIQTFDMSKLPKKPPRLHTSISDSQIPKIEEAKLNNDGIANKKRNPPLPRKPTYLRREDKVENATFYIDASELDNLNGEGNESSVKNEAGSCTTSGQMSKERNLRTGFFSDSSLGKLPKTSPFLKPNNQEHISNVGCTPPLPRRLAKRPSPANIQVTDSSKDVDNSISMKNGGSGSPPDENRVQTSSTGLYEIKTDIQCEEPKPNFLDSETVVASNNFVTENSKRSPNTQRRVCENKKASNTEEMNEQNSLAKTGSNRRKPLPDLPPSPVANQGPPRRAPPGLPKRPSLDGKRKFAPPPLPNAPRPASIMRENAVKVKPFRRSQSAGDIFDGNAKEDNDSVYSEAYEHVRGSVHLGSLTKDDVDADDGEYESPDKEMVKEFIEARQQKSQAKLKKNKENKLLSEPKSSNKTRLVSTTYSSSSDDTEDEYVEPDSPKPEKRLSKALPSPTNTVSSGGSSNYVEAIHVSKLTKNDETESITGEYEFRPFNDMDSGWSEPKLIDWEYKGESDDDSDGSYVEPEGMDDSEDDEDDEAFSEEPLYQVYQAVALEKERTLSLKRRKKSSSGGTCPRGRTATLGYGTLRGGKMLWSQLPEVRNTGLLENLSAEQRKLQEAIFEVITSEASYLKSLNLLVDHFLNAQEFSPDSKDPILDKQQISEVFANIMEIVNVSERFLDDLRTRQRQSVMIESISDIVTDHANNYFQAYVTYCSRQYKQDRSLTNLRKTNWRFSEALEKLERDSRVFGLTLQSFLVLPMQRVTRYPLLVDAIVRRCEPGHKEYYKTDGALKAVNEIVHKCNEGARKEERQEEMVQIDKIISFLKMNSIKLVTDDRWLLRRGPIQLLEVESKSTLSNTLRGRFRKYRVKPIYLFLFSDLLVVTKKKSETVYSVIDYAKRNMIRIQETSSKATNAFLLVFLENFEKKTKELNVRADNETDLTRWREAFEPPTSTDDEKVYGSWDCPQVHALHDYQAQQSDELSLVPGDVVNVLRKLPDGWYEGERIRDGVCGWFPANHTEEIRNEHVRARNLHQRYRLLAASTAFLDTKKR